VVKLFDPNVDKRELAAIKKVLYSGLWASGSGIANVKRFEDSFTRYVGCSESVAVNSGTAALHLALSLFDVKGKEVLVPSLTFVSTVHAVLYNGARPVFVDVEEDALCMDPADMQKKMTRNTAAVMPVHFGGMPCNLEPIRRAADDSKIAVIEDAAHACGTRFQGKKIGSHGHAVCFSFHPVKNLSMPTGGAVTLNGEQAGEWKKRLASGRWCGISDRHGVYYDISELGWNFYMNEFSAAIGLVQLKKLEMMNKKRKKIGKQYNKEIEIENKMPYSDECCYHLYWIRTKNRDEFIAKMNKSKIEVGVHYRPVHLMSFYKSDVKLPVTERVWPEIVTLPMHTNLKQADVDSVIENVNKHAR
jgi:perosamine synthetase